MICPKCKSIYYFVVSSGSTKCSCEKCGYKGSYKTPDYSNYHTNKYSNKIVRTFFTDPLLKKMICIVNFKSSDRVLDYGCGIGEYTNELTNRVDYIVGLDRDIEMAKKKFPKSNFISFEGKKLPLKENSLDKIICINVIEHIYDYEFLLSEFNRLLRKNGQIFITTMDKNFWLHWLDYDLTHTKEWDFADFKKMMEKYFVVHKVIKYGSFFNYYPFNFILVNFLKPEICILAIKK